MALKGDYLYNPADFTVTSAMKRDFEQLGYIVIRNLFSLEEIGYIERALSNESIQCHGYNVLGDVGTETRMCLWKHPGDDVTGMVARCEKMVNTAEELLDGEVYHYHSKLIMKGPKTGGKWHWHQDYGYWYNNGMLYPDALTVAIAVDECLKINGCLDIVPGSHLCGRIEHSMVGGQTGADMERVKQITEKLGVQAMELAKGDALLFHSNLIHSSTQNTSNLRRWNLCVCYVTRNNSPVYEHHCPQYTPLTKVSNGAILMCKRFEDAATKDFMDPKTDSTAIAEDTK